MTNILLGGAINVQKIESVLCPAVYKIFIQFTRKYTKACARQYKAGPESH